MATLKDYFKSYEVENVEVKDNIIKVVKEDNEYAWIDVDETLLDSLTDHILENLRKNTVNENEIMVMEKLCLRTALQNGLKLTNISDVYSIGYLAGMFRMAKEIKGGKNVIN